MNRPMPTRSETESLFRVIRELKSQGRGIVSISHRMKKSSRFAMTLPFFVTDNLLLSAKWHH